MMPMPVGVIFGVTYFFLALGRIPGLGIDRAGIAVVGATAMIAVGALSLSDAAAAVDHETIVLLFAMMIVASYLQISGFFALATDRAARTLTGPRTLLAAVIAVSGILSAFLVNDVVCVALTPLAVELCRKLRRPPIPYLVGLATASNIGSVATITGNPQNIIIGSLSSISYLRFCARLAPVALIGLALDFLVVAWVYRRSLDSLQSEPASQIDSNAQSPIDRALLYKSVCVTLVTIALFFTHIPIALTALGAAAILLLGRVRPDGVYRAVDWPLLVMFCGLFSFIGIKYHADIF